MKKLKISKQKIRLEIETLKIAYKRKDVPLYAKLMSIIVVGYALSPIDLIPDFIPVIGYLDDLIIVPLGIYLCIKMIPKDVMKECRMEAQNVVNSKKSSCWIAGLIIIFIWIILLAYILLKIFR